MVGTGGTLTSVPGIAVGHAADAEAATGCTAILGPFRAAVDVRGLATGSRELDALSPLHLVDRVDALLFTGGSAYGLGAADGVMAWLEERGRGFDTGAAVVPIVPTAVIYDLGVGDASVRPGPEMGRAAAEAATTGTVEQGRVGAGTGATVGKLRGAEGAEAGGLGSWAADHGEFRVGALAVVNAFGDVLDSEGGILAGCRGEDGGYVDTARALRDRSGGPAAGPARNTTLVAVATDRPLGRRDLQIVARQAANGLVRRVSPAGSPLDGDMVFALSTGEISERAADPGRPPWAAPPAADPPRLDEASLMGVAAAAQESVERSIEAAVRAGRGEAP